MKLLRTLLENEKKAHKVGKSEMDPAHVTATDIATYVRHVKKMLKGQPMYKAMVTRAVADIAEDCPKFGANPGAVKRLALAVCKSVCESVDEIVIKKGSPMDEVRGRINALVKKHHTSKINDEERQELNNLQRLLYKKVEEAFNGNGILLNSNQLDESEKVDEKLEKAKAQAMKASKESGCIKHVRKNKDGSYYVSDWFDRDNTPASYTNGKALHESHDHEDDEDEDPDVKRADDEVKKRKIKMMSPRAEKALSKKLAKADKKDQDKKHQDDKVTEGWDSGEDEDDEDPDVKKADDEVKKRKIKMMSPATEKALKSKLAKADKKDESKKTKEVDESVKKPVAGSFLESLLSDYLD